MRPQRLQAAQSVCAFRTTPDSGAAPPGASSRPPAARAGNCRYTDGGAHTGCLAQRPTRCTIHCSPELAAEMPSAGEFTGGVPEWTKGADCKSVIHGFESHRRLQKRGFRQNGGRTVVVAGRRFLLRRAPAAALNGGFVRPARPWGYPSVRALLSEPGVSRLGGARHTSQRGTAQAPSPEPAILLRRITGHAEAAIRIKR